MMIAGGLCLLSACQGDDPDQEEVALTGDSTLLANNISSFDSTVYFNGQFLGVVGGDTSRSWTVPAGNHQVRVDNAERDNSEDLSQNYTFTSGQTTSITVDWEFDF